MRLAHAQRQERCRVRPIAALALAPCFACTAPTPEPTSLQPLSVHVVERVDQPSGLAFAGGRLYAVGDQKAKIYALAADGSVASDVNLALGIGEQTSLEAIAIAGDTAVVAREASAALIHVSLGDGSVLFRSTVPDALDANSGLEGVMIRPGDQQLFALKEKSPTLLIQIDTAGVEQSAVQLNVASDLSDLCYLCNDEFLAVSQADRALLRLKIDGTLVAKWSIPVVRAEGLAYDGSQRLYIVDEQSNELSVFEFDAGCD